jgi:hypothetical protein
MPRYLDSLRLAAILALCFCALGCTQKTVQPVIRVGPPPQPGFAAPESTLLSLAKAVHDRDPSLYGLCFADTVAEQREFHAVFDSADAVAFEQSGGVPPYDWTRAQELTFFPQFVAYLPNALYDVFLALDPDLGIIDFGGPTQKLIYHEHYRVWSALTPVCAGRAAITLERVRGTAEYKITFWADERDTANVRTWGAARLNGR